MFRTSSFHSGADWEAGRVGRARSEEAPLGAESPSPLGRRGDAGKIFFIFMRWAAPHGWCLGKIASQNTNSTLRLYKNFNYRTSWTDGWENHMLTLDKYDSGPDLHYPLARRSVRVVGAPREGGTGARGGSAMNDGDPC